MNYIMLGLHLTTSSWAICNLHRLSSLHILPQSTYGVEVCAKNSNNAKTKYATGLSESFIGQNDAHPATNAVSLHCPLR